jgi:hypothetical protein
MRLDDRRAQLLLGPRQVGKTVLLLQVADDLLAAGWPGTNLTYFDFSDDRLTEPVTAREVVDARPVGTVPEHPRVFLFDEIRLAPNWDRWLKQAVDHGGHRIVATDSAASVLRDGSRESGQGRWDEWTVEGLSFQEMAKLLALPGESPTEVMQRLNLVERYLAIGGFPEHAWREDFPEVRRRLRSDIADRAILRDLSGRGVDVQRIKDLFVYLVQDSGAQFNAENRARDLKADPRTVRDWLQLLTDTLMVVTLERNYRHAAAGLRSRPKVFAVDPGLVSAFASSPVQDSEVRARSFEAGVFRHLREVAREREGSLSYFRQRDDLEVDFVLEIAGRKVGIEVTSSSRVKPDKVERLRQAGKELGAERLFLIHGGLVEGSVTSSDVVFIPLAKFLLDPAVVILGANHV